jgi:hypothetical protein
LVELGPAGRLLPPGGLRIKILPSLNRHSANTSPTSSCSGVAPSSGMFRFHLSLMLDPVNSGTKKVEAFG